MKIILSICTMVLLMASPVLAANSASVAQAQQGQEQVSVNQIGNSFNTKTLRPLPYLDAPTVSTYGGPSAFYNPSNDPGPAFISAKLLVKLLNKVDTNQEIKDEGDIEIAIQSFKPLAPCRGDVTFTLADEAMNWAQMETAAIVSVRSEGEEINSAALAVKLAKIARSYGATKIILIREGLKIELRSSGIGIGFNQSAAYQGTTAGSLGGVSTGGTGWSKGEATYVKLPYLVAVIAR